MAWSAEEVIKRWMRLKSDRMYLDTHLQEIADFMLPNKADITTKRQPGQKRFDDLLDNTGMLSLELLAGALHGLLTNPNSIWFELTTGVLELDELDSIRPWLQDTAKRMLLVLNNSNFQTEIHELYLNLCGFGTAPMSIEEDDDIVVRFSSKPIQEIVIDENYKGQVDTVMMHMDWSLRSIIQKWGIEKLSQKMKDQLGSLNSDQSNGDQVYSKTYPIVFALYPTEQMNQKGKPKNFKKFTSQWVSVDDRYTIEVGGFNEFPWVIPRWSKIAGEKYGRSPAMTALPEVKMVNKMQETIIKSAQKVVDPPLQLPHDGFILPLNTKPGGINYALGGTNSRDEIKPIFNNAQIDFGQLVMEDVRARIKSAFYVDQLKLRDGPQKTATEVLQHTEESMRLLSPLLGRQNSELLSPLIDRVYSIMDRRGMIPEIPEALEGKQIRVQYSSMIAKAQKLSEVNSILRFIDLSAPFVQIDPAAAEVVDAEESVRDIARVLGIPSRMIRDKKAIQAIREAKAQAQKEASDLEEKRRESEVNRNNSQAAASLSMAQSA